MRSPERGEDRGVHEQVGLGVEVAAEGGDAARQARELPVRVVEHRLQLQEQRRRDVTVRGRSPTAAAKPTRRPGEHDRRRRHAQRQERPRDEVRRRSEDELAQELEAAPRLAGPA